MPAFELRRAKVKKQTHSKPPDYINEPTDDGFHDYRKPLKQTH
jgi:hypothetical protein